MSTLQEPAINRPRSNAALRHITAFSVTLLTAGQLAAGLIIGFRAAAGILGLPQFVLVSLWLISGAASLLAAIYVYVHVLRIERLLARSQSTENVSWALFEDSRTRKTDAIPID